MARKDFYARLVYARRMPLIGKLAYYLLKMLGVEIPASVEIGEGFYLVHGGFGVVIHPKTVIGNNVKVYPGVTFGRTDVYKPFDQSRFEQIVVEDYAVIAAGAKVLCKEGKLTIGEGTVVGANAVLLESTNPYEIWAGIPARKVGIRTGDVE